MGREHVMPADRVHYRWDNSIQPVLEIEPGDVVIYDLREVSDGQISPAATARDLTRLDMTRVYPLAGPIAVRGARPGDALEIEMLELTAGSWGWSGINPGFRLLPEEATEPYLHIWDLTAGTAAELRPGIRVPLDPFCGTIGVAPKTPGSHPVMPPGRFGGNMDIRHLTRGATLFLPVWVADALFSCGDPHERPHGARRVPMRFLPGTGAVRRRRRVSRPAAAILPRRCPRPARTRGPPRATAAR
jgi:acetamidase/formamidase